MPKRRQPTRRRATRSDGKIVRVTLPAPPPEILGRALAPHEIDDAYEAVFKLFGVDPLQPGADGFLWEAMAKALFPYLAMPQDEARRPGAPKKQARKDSITKLVEMAEAWDLFIQRERARGFNFTKAQMIRKFGRAFPQFKQQLEINKQHSGPTLIAVATLEQKLKIGRSNKGRRHQEMPAAFYSLPSSARRTYKALFYADHHPFRLSIPTEMRRYGSIRGDVLRTELLRLDPRSPAGKDRMREIEAEARRIVPEEIRLHSGWLIRPFKV